VKCARKGIFWSRLPSPCFTFYTLPQTFKATSGSKQLTLELFCSFKPASFIMLDTGLPGIDSRTRSDFFRGPPSNIPAPAAQSLYYFWRDRGCQGDPDEDEGFMYGVGEGQLRPETWQKFPGSACLLASFIDPHLQR
jgi:hypothetical protein